MTTNNGNGSGNGNGGTEHNGNGSSEEVNLDQVFIHLDEDTWVEETEDGDFVAYSDDVREAIGEEPDSDEEDEEEGRRNGNGNGSRR